MTSTSSRFDGAVHEEANADIGSNRQGERVVRLDLTYTRGTAPSSTTMILTLDAAIALRNQLDGLFDAAGVDDSRGLVDEDDACPRCRRGSAFRFVPGRFPHDSGVHRISEL